MSEPRVTRRNFERDLDFDLRGYVRHSFGAFQKEPANIVLRFTLDAVPDATAFLFHPNQTVAKTTMER